MTQRRELDPLRMLGVDENVRPAPGRAADADVAGDIEHLGRVRRSLDRNARMFERGRCVERDRAPRDRGNTATVELVVVIAGRGSRRRDDDLVADPPTTRVAIEVDRARTCGHTAGGPSPRLL